jgi:hypothetical protein
MGLDMYLEVRKFVPAKNYKVINGDYVTEPVSVYSDLVETTGLDKLISDESVGATVTATAIYWRKVNSIHNWFIQNCAKGVDECQPIYVSRERLELLLETVDETIKSKNAELLPPTSGFFFGSTDVDEWYWKDLAFTKRELKSLLKKTESELIDFIYQASW